MGTNQRRYERGYLQGLSDAADEIDVELGRLATFARQGRPLSPHTIIGRLTHVENTLRDWVTNLADDARERSA